MKPEKEILERMKLIGEVLILAGKINAPIQSLELMLETLVWVLDDSKEEEK